MFNPARKGHTGFAHRSINTHGGKTRTMSR